MRRYWIPEECISEAGIVISGEIFRHICGVCRREKGHQFELITDRGVAYLVKLVEVGKKSAIACIESERNLPPLRKPEIHLALSFPRIAVFENLIEKSVELGIHSIHPFVSQYSFVRSKRSDRIKNKTTRWHKILRSAQQQSGRANPLYLSDINSLEEVLVFFNQSANAKGLFAYEGQAALALRPALTDIKKHKPNEIWIFVGSEGGFSSEEVDVFAANGLQSVSMGDQVLRVETACVALVSVIKYEMHLMGGDNVGSV